MLFCYFRLCTQYCKVKCAAKVLIFFQIHKYLSKKMFFLFLANTFVHIRAP